MLALLAAGITFSIPALIGAEPARAVGTWVPYFSVDFNDGSMVDAQGRGFVDVPVPNSNAHAYVYGGVLHVPPGSAAKTQGFDFARNAPAEPLLTLPNAPQRDYLVEAGIRLPWTDYNYGAFWLHRPLHVDDDQTNIDEYDIIESFGPGGSAEPCPGRVWTNIYLKWPHPDNSKTCVGMADWNPYLWNKASGIYRPGTANAYTWIGSDYRPDEVTGAGNFVFDRDEIIAFTNYYKKDKDGNPRPGSNTDPASFLEVDWVRVYQCSDSSGCWGRSLD